MQAALREPGHHRLDAGRRIERVAAAVHREERLVGEVVRKEGAGDAEVAIAQHQDEAVQRQEAGVGRGVAHGDVERAGAAVGDARHHDAVLVHVVGALHVVEDRRQILVLRRHPPLRAGPGLRQHVDLLDAGERADRAVAASARLRPAHAAVQLHAHLVARLRVVGGRERRGCRGSPWRRSSAPAAARPRGTSAL